MYSLHRIKEITERMPDIRQMIEMENKFSAQTFHSLPVAFERGEGNYLWDINGKRYLDWSAMFSAVQVGYNNREMVETLSEYLKFPPIAPRYLHRMRVGLEELLAEIAPDKLSKCYLCPSGSDAVEAALKFARKSTKRYKILSLWEGYHGSTLGALSAHGMERARSDFEPLLPGFVHASPPYCYRCDFNLDYPECNLVCLQMLEKTIIREGREKVAAVIVEPILAAGGIIVPPRQYLPELRKICDRQGVMMILDEIVTGFGRTGKLFCCQHYDVVPDMLVLGKGMTSGYVPQGAVIISEDLSIYDPANPNEFPHWHTQCAHPLACVAAITSTKIIIRDKLAENTTKIGNYFQKGLVDLAEENKGCGEVRGMGLLHGLEIVKKKETKEMNPEVTQLIVEKCLEKGLIIEASHGAQNSVLIFHPPLTVTEECADEALEILGTVIREATS